MTGVVYGMGRIDASGRISDRTITQALGWRPGDRITVTATTAVVLARRDPTGMVTLPAKPYVAVPAALRHRCGIHPGDRVLLAATPADNQLAIYPLASVHHAIHTAAVAGGDPT